MSNNNNNNPSKVAPLSSPPQTGVVEGGTTPIVSQPPTPVIPKRPVGTRPESPRVNLPEKIATPQTNTPSNNNNNNNNSIAQQPVPVVVNYTRTQLGPVWKEGWERVESSGTIHTFVVNNKAFIIGRHPSSIMGVNLLSGTHFVGPSWDDRSGWNQPQYNGTIQTFVVNNKAYLIARGGTGIVGYRFNDDDNTFTLKLTGPSWNDPSGWYLPQYYTTIQTFVVNNKAYLIARGGSGIIGYRFNEDTLVFDRPITGPSWSDATGWNQPQYNGTIQTFVVNNKAYLIARGSSGIIGYRFNEDTLVFDKPIIGPSWSDATGWSYQNSHCSIQTFIVDSKAYLVGKDYYSEVKIIGFNDINVAFDTVVQPILYKDPTPSIPPGFDKSIKVIVAKNSALLLLRYCNALVGFKFNNNSFEYCTGLPEWNSKVGWAAFQNYSKIESFNLEGKNYLIAKGPESVEVWTN